MFTALEAKPISLSITVKDVERSLHFYTVGLGFTIAERFEEEGKLMGAMLRAGDAYIGVSQDDFAKGHDRVKGIGIRIFFETDQDLELLAQQATQAEITINGIAPLPWGPLAFAVTDHDGFQITVMNAS